MNRIDIRLKDTDKELLQSFIGTTLQSIEHDEFVFTNSSSQAVRLNVNNQVAYLYSFTESLDYFGSTEDVAVWSVESTEYPMILSKSFITMPVQQAITGVSILQEHQMLFDHGTQTYDVWVTRGIILDLGDHQISFEKPVWFSEEIIIRKGYDLLNSFRPVDDIENADIWEDGIEMKCERLTELL